MQCSTDVINEMDQKRTPDEIRHEKIRLRVAACLARRTPEKVEKRRPQKMLKECGDFVMHEQKSKLKPTVRTTDEPSSYIEIHELTNKLKRTVRTNDEVNSYIETHELKNKLKRAVTTNDQISRYIEIHELKNKLMRTVNNFGSACSYIEMHDRKSKLKLIELKIVRVMQRDLRMKS